jgi:hypothetical protein
MAVRFPISTNDGRGQYPEITDLVIKVNGNQFPFRRANYPDIRYYNQDNTVSWAEFDVTFPAGQEVPIQVAYNLNGSGYSPFTAFYYILETGAGWKDTIGSADIILRLPYQASAQNVIMNMQIGWAETPSGGVIEGNEVRWHFDNFEPNPDGPVQNMEFALVAPVAWQTVLKERNNVAKNPNDGEAWGRLAKSTKEIFLMNKGYRTDAGGEELYQSSIDAYEKCLALKPDDAQWHAGFADLLASRSYWDTLSNGPTTDTYRALDEIHTALELAPNDAKVLEIAQNISYMFPDGMSKTGSGYEFPWLTQTPTPIQPIVPLFNPADIPGTYQINPVIFDGREAQLTINLRSDLSADMETKFEDGQTYIASGAWETGDITITVSLVDQFKERIEFVLFVKEPPSNNLEVFEYPSTYAFDNNETMELIKIGITTPTDTPRPTDMPGSTPSETVPASKPSLPFCGSAALIGAVWLARKRK